MKRGKGRGKAKNKRAFQSKKLQERIKKGSERGGKNWSIVNSSLDIPMWRPKDGSHIIDIIPYYAGEKDPLVEKGDPTYTFEFYVHVKVGPNESSFVCPAEMFGKPCPICEDRQRIRDEGADKTVWKKLFPKRRNLYNVISYDDSDAKKGVQVWDVSYFYFEKPVMAISKKVSRNRGGKPGKEQIVNFADPEEGRSISFTIEPAQSKGDYPAYIGHTFDERDYEIEDDILDSTYILDGIVKESSYEDIKAAYYGNSKKTKPSTRDKKQNAEDDVDDLISEVEDLDDMEELEDFIDEHELSVKIKKRDDEDSVKDKIIKELEESQKKKYSISDILGMSKKELKRVIKTEGLDDSLLEEAEDLDDLKDLICGELDIEDDIPF